MIHAKTFMDVILADCMVLHAFGPQNGDAKICSNCIYEKTKLLCGPVSANFCARRSAMVNLSLKKKLQVEPYMLGMRMN